MTTLLCVPRLPRQVIFESDDLDSAVSHAIEMGFAVIRRPRLLFVISEADKSWRAFCDQPPGHRELFTVRHKDDDPAEGPDNGYVPKGDYLPLKDAHENEHVVQDTKLYFHYRPFIARLLRRRKGFSHTEEYLLNSAGLLYRKLEQEILRIGQALDNVLPGFQVAEGLRANAHPEPFGHVLRYLLYKKAEEAGEELARGHTDRCAITLHVADSRPGLVVYLGGGEQFLVETQPDTLILFFGKRLSVRTNGRVRSLNHRVISPADASRPTNQRTCTVLFAHVPDDYKRFNPKWMYK